MNAAQETLQAVAYKISEAMYTAQQEQQPSMKDDDDVVIDAEAV